MEGSNHQAAEETGLGHTEMKAEKTDLDQLERDTHVQSCSGKQMSWQAGVGEEAGHCQLTVHSHADNRRAGEGDKQVLPLPHRVWRDTGCSNWILRT